MSCRIVAEQKLEANRCEKPCQSNAQHPDAIQGWIDPGHEKPDDASKEGRHSDRADYMRTLFTKPGDQEAVSNASRDNSHDQQH